MGVLTVMYSIPPKLMKKIQEENEHLGYVTGDAEDEEGGDWSCDSIDFDKHYSEVIGLLREAGYPQVHKVLDVESNAGELEFESYDLVLVKPGQVKKVYEALKDVTPASLKTLLEGKELTDYYGQKMTVSDVESYLSEVPRIKKLLKKAVEEGHSILVAEA